MINADELLDKLYDLWLHFKPKLPETKQFMREMIEVIREMEAENEDV